MLLNFLTTKIQNMKTLDLAKVWSWLCAVLLVALTLIPGRANEDESFYIVCPSDQYVTCQDEIWDLSIYGNAYYHDYDGDHDAGASSNTWALNSCNVGAVYRTWTVEDYNWVQHSCTQVIYVSSTGNFTESDITWPMQDYSIEGCNPPTDPNSLPPGYNYPTYNQEECSMVAHTYDDQWFTFSATCKKLIRQWTVIDWCQYNSNSGSNYGKWTYWQVIKVSNSEVPNLVCLDDVTVSSYNCNDALVELPDLTVDGSSCGGYFTIKNNSPHATSNGPNASGVYPLGTTTVKYTVEYGCGSKKTCTFNVTVADNKGPTAYCIASVAIPLMGIDSDDDGVNDEGMVEIWAKDLDFGSSSSCGHDPLRFSFSEDPDDGFITFTCDHLGENLVDMWVTDNVGNQSYCTVKVVIQNNSANIENCVRTVPDINENEDNEESEEGDEEEEEEYMFRLIGEVTDQFNNGVEDIAVTTSYVTSDTIIQLSIDTTINITLDSFINASGNLIVNEIHDSIFTIEVDTFIQEIDHVFFDKSDENGAYAIEELPAEITLQLSGERSNSDDARIDRDDVLYLLDYLLGEVTITDPLILLAGDTDDNGTLDFNDVMNLVNKVNGNGELPTESPWLIFNANQEFDNPLDPFSSEMIYVKEIQGEHDKEMIEDFVAILKGDLVANSANSNFIQTEKPKDYSALSQKTEIPVEVREFIAEEILNNIKVFPNPVKNILNFELELLKDEQVILTMYNSLGEKLMLQSFDGLQGYNSFQVDLDAKENGIMIYEIQYGKQSQSGRIIKI